ncbi:Alkaline phosphatase [hydrothermal vent metagenome]|uniref:Alkaline phosphatase n=1 Tax=hydrothermal vent metagenome TaxID=652676 RepID=A0A1W1DZU6_9ZZZZ
MFSEEANFNGSESKDFTTYKGTQYGVGDLLGDMQDNIIHGLDGNDWIRGGEGDDVLYGDVGNDGIRGDGGNDTLDGGTGDDSLWGGSGNDIIYGGNGDDRIYGGTGADIMNGGEGADIFYYSARTDVNSGRNNNTLSGNAFGESDAIIDFQIQGDVLDQIDVYHLFSYSYLVGQALATSPLLLDKFIFAINDASTDMVKLYINTQVEIDTQGRLIGKGMTIENAAEKADVLINMSFHHTDSATATALLNDSNLSEFILIEEQYLG